MFRELLPTGEASSRDTHISLDGSSAPGRVVIADTELLLGGKYQKLGADLLITGKDGHKVVISNYFNHDKAPDLVNAQGAGLSGHVVESLAVSSTPGQYVQVGAPAGGVVIGKVERLGGTATVQHANGVTEELKVGDPVLQGDVVQTNDGSLLAISFVDGTAFNMGANARMVLNELVYEPNGSNNSAVFSLVKGTITFVAGQAAKTGNMRVETPVATMGIRGTTVNWNGTVDINDNMISATVSLMPDPDGKSGVVNVLDKATGTIIATITSTSTSFTLTPTANLGVLAQQLNKTPEQIAQELAIAQILYPIWLSQSVNAQNPQDPQPKGPAQHGSSGQPGGSTVAFADTPIGTITNTASTQGGGSTNNSGNNSTPPPHVNNAPSIFIDGGPDLIEKVSEGDAAEVPGAPISVAEIFKVDDGAVIYDIGAMIVDGWVLDGNGIYRKDGVYGSAYLDINGDTLTYVLDNDNPLTDRLGPGEHPEEKFKVQVIDNEGARASSIATFVVQGRNDPPQIVETQTDRDGAVVEDAAVTAGKLHDTGVITFTDAELHDAHTLANTTLVPTSVTLSEPLPGFPNGITGYLGTLSLMLNEDTSDDSNVATISWTFEVEADNPYVQALAAGQTITQVYTLVIDDGQGGQKTQLITITITGTNDGPNSAPTILPLLSVLVGEVIEDADTAAAGTPDTTHEATGTITFRDIDLIDTHTATFELKSTDASADLPGFAEGVGTSVAHLGEFELLGVSEDNTDTVNTGTVSWRFRLDNHDETFQSLAEGQTITQVYTVTLKDDKNATVSQDITITITGTNDAPVITVGDGNSDVAAIDETNAGLAAAGTLSVSDVDIINTVSASVVAVQLGGVTNGLTANDVLAMLTVDPGNVIDATTTTGAINWAFDSDTQAFDFLAQDEFLTLTYTVRATDSNGTPASDDQTVTITITGTNDAPVISGADNSDAVNETDSTISVDGALNVVDADVSDTVTMSVDSVSVHPSSTFNGVNPLSLAQLKGMMSVTFEALDADPLTGEGFGWFFGSGDAGDSAFDFLANGETLVLDYVIKATDDAASTGTDEETVRVTITGTNDRPQITAVNVIGEVTEDAGTTLTDSGSITFIDVDATDTSDAAVALTSTDGAPELAAALANALVLSGDILDDHSGTIGWTFDLDNSLVQYLAEDETITATYAITVQDDSGALNHSATETVTVTINGVNDAPTIGAATLPAVDEDTASPAGATIADLFVGAFDDVDSGASLAGLAVAGNTADSETQGSWQYSCDGGDQWIDVGAVTEGAALALDAATLLRFVPVANYNGAPPPLTVYGLDDTFAGPFSNAAGSETVDVATRGGSTPISDASSTIGATINPVNDAPVGTDTALTIEADTPTVLNAADFGFTDPVEGDALVAVRIDSLPSVGTLAYEGVVITTEQINAGYEVLVADLDAGKLTFTPDAEAVGDDYASFTFQVRDDGGTANGGVDLDPSANTLTFNVESTDNPPVAVEFTIATSNGYDVTSLYDELLDGVLQSIDSDQITLIFEDHVIVVDAHQLTFTGDPPGDIDLTGGTITGIHIYDQGSGDLIAEATGFTIAATAFDDAIVQFGDSDPRDPTALNDIFQAYAYNALGGEGADVIVTGNQADTIDTGAGADHVEALGGDDVILVHDTEAWSIDGGAGTDTIRVVGALDFTQDQDGPGPSAQNVEIIDLNVNAAVKVNFDPETIAGFNSDHLIRILGNADDVVTLMQSNGVWTQADTGVAYAGDGSSLTDGVSFDVWQFDNGNAGDAATVYLQSGIVLNQPPVILTDTFTIQESAAPGGAFISYLSIDDPDAGSDQLLVSATAMFGTVEPNVDPGTLAEINSALFNGIIYTPIGSPATDMVTLTVNDQRGGTDTVNFLFNVSTDDGVNFIGTENKDVIFGTGGNDTFFGSAGADTFVFQPHDGIIGNDMIADFSHAQGDKLDVTGYLDDTGVEALIDALQDLPEPTNTITFDNGDSVIFAGVDVRTLGVDDFIVRSFAV